MCNDNVIHAKISVPYITIELDPMVIEQSAYDALIEAEKVKPNKVYYVVPDGSTEIEITPTSTDAEQ